jgi:hypothetical protein
MRVGHRVGGTDDARQAGDIADLLEHRVVHLGDQAFVAINDGRDAHRALGFEAPFRRRYLAQP